MKKFKVIESSRFLDNEGMGHIVGGNIVNPIQPCVITADPATYTHTGDPIPTNPPQYCATTPHPYVFCPASYIPSTSYRTL